MALQHVFIGGMGGHPHVAKRDALRGNRRAYSTTKATTSGNMPLRARGVLLHPLAIVGHGELHRYSAPWTTESHVLNGQDFGVGHVRVGGAAATRDGVRGPYSLINRNNLGKPHAYWAGGPQLVFKRREKCS